MKKQTIKKIEENWFYRNIPLLCLIGILVLLLFFSFTLNLFKPRITICWNENYTNSLMATSERGLSEIMLERNVTKCLKKEIITPTEGFFRGVTFYFCDYNISYEEVCEKKEVDEIDDGWFENRYFEEKTWKEFVEELQEMFNIKKIIQKLKENGRK